MTAPAPEFESAGSDVPSGHVCVPVLGDVGVWVFVLRLDARDVDRFERGERDRARIRGKEKNAILRLMGRVVAVGALAGWALGVTTSALTRVDLVQLARLVAEELQHTTRRHRIRVVSTRPPLPPILADRARLRQVLSNLLENAVKYSTGGTIQIRLSVQDAPGGVSKAILAVHDEGSGLDVDQLDRIFAPFEQTARTNLGLGLGLHLARQLARIHGGDLWAESRGPMNGSTFILALPLT